MNFIGYIVSIYPSLTETFVQREIDHFASSGHKVIVFALNKPSNLKAYDHLSDKKNIEIRYIKGIKPLFKSVIFLPYLLVFKFVRILKVLSLIIKSSGDLPLNKWLKVFGYFFYTISFLNDRYMKKIKSFHCHFSTASTIGLFASILSNIKYSITFHASGDVFYNPYLISEKIERAKICICESHYVERYVNLITDFEFESKIHTVFNSVGEQEYNLKSDYNLHNPIKLVAVGSFTYFKGYPTLIESIKYLIDSNIKIHLDVVGIGQQQFVIEKLINKYQLTDYITLLGSKNNKEVGSIIANSDILLMASEIYKNGIRDGMPTVLLEAMMIGTPVISTYISGIPNLIKHEENGLLVPENDPKALYQEVLKMLKSIELRQQLAANAKNTINQNFNKLKNLKKLSDLILN